MTSDNLLTAWWPILIKSLVWISFHNYWAVFLMLWKSSAKVQKVNDESNVTCNHAELYCIPCLSWPPRNPCYGNSAMKRCSIKQMGERRWLTLSRNLVVETSFLSRPVHYTPENPGMLENILKCIKETLNLQKHKTFSRKLWMQFSLKSSNPSVFLRQQESESASRALQVLRWAAR